MQPTAHTEVGFLLENFMHIILILAILALTVYVLVAENPPKWLINPPQPAWVLAASILYILALWVTQ